MLFIDDASLKSRGDLSHISFSRLFPDYLPVPSFICWSDFHHGRCQLPPERDNRCLRLQDMPPEESQMRMHSKYFLFICYPSQPNVKYVLYQLQTAESFEFLRWKLPTYSWLCVSLRPILAFLGFPSPSTNLLSFHQPSLISTIQVNSSLSIHGSLWLLSLIQNVLDHPGDPGISYARPIGSHGISPLRLFSLRVAHNLG
ncbi:hypothetical protein DER44DRAFT_472314 [Fusarium oxysporum]|nr:hypothetical protein DER44DRAFT_472314 [Fusarium oxysporum]